MLHFKSAQDLQQLSPDDPSYPVVADLVQRLIVNCETEGYDPDADGWVVLVQEGDVDQPLSDIWDDWRLVDVPFEGITREGDCFLAVFLANNQFGLVFVIPDAPWLTEEVRNMIEENLDPPMTHENREVL